MTRKLPDQIEEFKSSILSADPTAKFEIDVPAAANGTWWIDTEVVDGSAIICWSRERDFGLYTGNEDDFGTRPNELHRSAQTAAARILQIINHLSAGRVAGLNLADLRQLTGLNQTEFAKRLGVEQPAVSRLENRSNVEVDTLRRAVEALGGQLVMTVRLPTFQAEFMNSAACPAANDEAPSVKTAKDVSGRTVKVKAGLWIVERPKKRAAAKFIVREAKPKGSAKTGRSTKPRPAKPT